MYLKRKHDIIIVTNNKCADKRQIVFGDVAQNSWFYEMAIVIKLIDMELGSTAIRWRKGNSVPLTVDRGGALSLETSMPKAFSLDWSCNRRFDLAHCQFNLPSVL